LMGGEFKISSLPGEGSTFSFEIRIAEVDHPGRAGASMASQGRIVALAPGQPAYRILVVDDQMEQRRLVASILGPIGFQVREASNGAQAIEIWEHWEPHLIWMDMRMPIMGGKEATRRIKATEKGKS